MIVKLLSLVLLLGGCAAPLSQVPPADMPAAVPAPQVTVGDAWTYRVRDGFTRLPLPDQHHRVTTVAANRIEVTAPVERSDGVQIYDREWNWLRRPATNLQTFEYSPAYQAYAFPLAPGKQWRSRVTATDPADGRRFPVWIDGTVLGWERVKVPAGEFDTLKIERAVYIEYYEFGVRGRSVIRESEWYSPAVKQSVKRETRSEYLRLIAGGASDSGFVRVRGGRDDSGPRYVQDDWLVYELSSHSIK